jgi:hypothetical protein
MTDTPASAINMSSTISNQHSSARITGKKANTMRFIMLTHQSPIPRSADRPGNNPEEWNHDSPLSLLDVDCLAGVTSVDS